MDIDEESVVFFGSIYPDNTAAVYGGPYSSPREADICFNKDDFLWSVTSTYPDTTGLEEYPKDFRNCATHELGHCVGLHHSTVSTNTMYYNSENRWDIWMRTIEWGDKAGAVYQVPYPGGSLTYNQVWAGFKGSDEPVVIQSDITIPSGKSLEIESNVYVKLGANVNLIVDGTLKIGDNVTFTKSGGSNWGGININSTGVLDVDGNITIEYATTGIDIYNTNGITNGSNVITIQNCSSAGIHIHNCDPTIQEVSISGVSAGYGGILVEGSSTDAILHDITITGCGKGIQQGNYSDADVYLCDIRSNTDHCIYMGTSAHIYMDDDGGYGHNTIDPASGKKAIQNTSTNGSIGAENNYWGEDDPTDSYFGYPANVDYDPYLESAYNGVGAGKVAVLGVSNDFVNAIQCERIGDW